MAYLRRVRLQRADADLRAADAADGGVAGIASRWGFTNFGRFAAAYRARYGCTPSQALGRARTGQRRCAPRIDRSAPSA
jgi:AraC-like DNA-binding protein